MPPPHRIIIDTDPGIDDVVTLALAARHKELDIVAVTTTYGNAPLTLTTRNAQYVLRLAGRPDIPVLPGAGRPLSRPLVTAPETHGPSGVGYAPVTPERPRDAVPNPAVLLDLLKRVSGPMTLVTLGPLTNLATALARDRPLVRDRVTCHLGLFGSLGERGDVGRRADFNAWSDPEAAECVLRSDLPTVMVGLDVTRQMTMTAGEVELLRESDHPLVQWLAAALTRYVEVHRDKRLLNGCILNDVLPIGEIVAPGILSFSEKKLTVVLDEGEFRGHTRIDSRGSSTQVATVIDVTGMRTILAQLFGHRWLTRATASTHFDSENLR